MENSLAHRAAAVNERVTITDIKVYQLKGHTIQSIIRVQTDQGVEGIGEAGLPAGVVQGYLDFMREWLVGQNALEINKAYADMTRMRAQWHAHWTQNPTVSGIDMALWDIAGKVLNCSVSRLTTGRFRDEIELYVNVGVPQDCLDAIQCRDWAQEVKADPRGFKTVKIGFDYMNLHDGQPFHSHRHQGGFLSPMLKQTELKRIRQAYENLREALGWDMDIIIHCHNEWDLPTALGLSEAVASIKPLWVEDALPVMYSDTWKVYQQQSAVRVMTGEKLEHPAEFLQFIQNGAVDLIHPDLAFVGGLTGGLKIADLAEMYYMPVVTHNVGSYVQLIANAHYGAMARNFVMSENRIPQGDLHEALAVEGYTVKNGLLKVPDGPGLGITVQPKAINEIIEGARWE
jgi:L-alanine-DL-glutamate epimerase-like enolase superfamily enzyme